MFTPSKEVFKKKCKEGNLIPVTAEIMADLETPVSAFLKLGGGPYSFLLESVEGGGGSGRYSFLGTGPRTVFRAKGKRAEFLRDGEWDGHETGDPLALLQDELARYRVVPAEGLPPFAGGAVGFLSYDAVRWIERLPSRLKDDLDLPDACFMLTDTLLAFDRYTNKITIIALAHVAGKPDAAYTKAVLAIQSVIEALKRPLPQDAVSYLGGSESRGFKSKVSQPRFEKMVEAAKEHIRAGDILQTVLSLRFEAPLYTDPFALYRSLRVLNPSPYMFYLNFGDFALVGASPELMVKKIGMEATVRPIAGTRPRGASPEEDRHLERELRGDEKEKAEHVMLVDLGRNDLGRVCVPGSVKVGDYMSVDRYSHVMHLVSTVTGQLKPGTTALDLVRATFPAGTVSGAPKIRAMEIIEELEPQRRGPYAGMVGYFDYSGNFDSAITIRTILAREGRAYIQTGAGIVADSVAEREYQECKHKARALVRAVEMAQGA
jgi:anthranilate synthase component 1